MNRRNSRARHPCRRFAGGWLVAALAAVCAFAPARTADRTTDLPHGSPAPRDLLDSIRSTALDPRRAVSLDRIDIEVGIAELQVERGLLIPSAPIDGRTVELIFLGQARFHCDPPDEIEADQIELFTGRPYMDASVEQAVLVLADQVTVERLLGRSRPADLPARVLDRAEAIHRDWLRTTERRNTGVESAIFRFLIGDPAFRSYFAIWCRGPELGDFIYQLDPEDQEQLTIASFVPLDVRGWKRRRLERDLRIQQRKGRWLGVRVDDIGAWDVWLSAPWSPANGHALPGHVGFETEHYTLDVTILRHSLRLRGTARLELVAQSEKRSTVTLELFRDLGVDRIVDGRGRELFFFRSGREVVVRLPEAVRRGERLVLDVTYGGRVLKWVGGRTFDLEDTAAWYPRCGTIDRARYDVTLRWPRRFQLVATGRYVDGGRRGRYRWVRREIDTPAIAFSFTLGDFRIEHRQIDHVELTVAFHRDMPFRLTPKLRSRVLDTAARSLRFFEETFGPYAQDYLTLVIMPRSYSQSYPGFVTLTQAVARPNPRRVDQTGAWVRDTTISHEIAHQWWGNLLGWWSYRDQWLSEAMANYSALLFHARTEGSGTTSLAELSAGWRDSLNQITPDGRILESLGPVVLGRRLNSSLAVNGYRAIVYRKGAVVLAMLARMLDEGPFLEMLHALLDAAANRVISTEDFLKSIERMSGKDLEGFARQYIYGTGIPRVFYDYRATRGEEGRWRIRGEAIRVAGPRRVTRVVRNEAGHWDVRSDFAADGLLDPAVLMVPYRLRHEIGSSATDPERPGGAAAGGVIRGLLPIHGWREEFEIDCDGEPIDLELDPGGELLAYFYSERSDPKQVSLFRARNLIAENRFAEADRVYRQALELPVADRELSGPYPWLRDEETEERRENSRIRLALARLYLDQGRWEQAREELDAVDERLDPHHELFPMEREFLRGRLELQHGEYGLATKRLKRLLRQAASSRRTWRAMLRRVELRSERIALTEAFALLAVSAYETNDRELSDWALEQAAERGADMTELRERRQS